MKSTDLRAKARAIFGPADAEPMPNQPNGAKALQQRANARPIPTYKVGGVVKKNDGGLLKKPVRGRSVTIPLEEERVKKLKKPANAPKMVDFEPRQPKTGKAPANAPKPPAMTRGPEADDVLITTRRGQQMLEAQKRREMEMEAERRKKQAAADKMLGMRMKNGGKMPDLTGDGKVTRADVLKGRGVPVKKAVGGRANMRSEPAAKNPRGLKLRVPEQMPAGYGSRPEPMPTPPPMPAPPVKKVYKDGGKVQTSADTAKKLATEMGGMKKGGKAKDGLAVMIAIGKVKKPAKKAMGGRANMRSEPAAKRGRGLKFSEALPAGTPEILVVGQKNPSNPTGYKKGGKPEKLAVGGAGKTRKGMAPIKKAQGGAAKVRKGMMSETGDIKQVVKPKKGLGGM